MNLIRVDDRLIHGQVSVGWGTRINPEYMIIANDEIASDPGTSELYLLGVPDGVKGAVIRVSEVKNYLGKAGKASYILVLSSIQDALTLLDSGFGFTELNIGGIHDSEGRKEINHYIFILKEDIDALEELMSRGVKVTVQDLPSNRKYDAEYILNKWKF